MSGSFPTCAAEVSLHSCASFTGAPSADTVSMWSNRSTACCHAAADPAEGARGAGARSVIENIT